ncbi:MAG: MinD/ParA family ATP-binding protein [Candidatus Hodarchaeales archaeon]|jgi:MinD-like ATPase involved in chromosome partitioning or flagellar assembly
MTTTFTVHSFKGGTGKTSLSINISALLAKSGKKVALFDFDFSGPSLGTRFNLDNPPKKFLNDFIEENASLEEIMVDLSPHLKTKGSFYVGFANPSTMAIQGIIAKGRRWQMKAMERILGMKRELNQNYDIDFISFDTSPGLHYSSLNAIVASDLVFLIVKLDVADFEGTLQMLKGIHSALEKKTWLVINQVPVYNDLEILMKGEHMSMIETKFQDVVDENFGILGSIPCLCDVGLGKGEIIFALEEPDSPFVHSLEKMTTVLASTETTED